MASSDVDVVTTCVQEVRNLINSPPLGVWEYGKTNKMTYKILETDRGIEFQQKMSSGILVHGILLPVVDTKWFWHAFLSNQATISLKLREDGKLHGETCPQGASPIRTVASLKSSPARAFQPPNCIEIWTNCICSIVHNGVNHPPQNEGSSEFLNRVIIAIADVFGMIDDSRRIYANYSESNSAFETFVESVSLEVHQLLRSSHASAGRVLVGTHMACFLLQRSHAVNKTKFLGLMSSNTGIALQKCLSSYNDFLESITDFRQCFKGVGHAALKSTYEQLEAVIRLGIDGSVTSLGLLRLVDALAEGMDRMIPVEDSKDSAGLSLEYLLAKCNKDMDDVKFRELVGPCIKHGIRSRSESLACEHFSHCISCSCRLFGTTSPTDILLMARALVPKRMFEQVLSVLFQTEGSLLQALAPSCVLSNPFDSILHEVMEPLFHMFNVSQDAMIRIMELMVGRQMDRQWSPRQILNNLRGMVNADMFASKSGSSPGMQNEFVMLVQSHEAVRRALAGAIQSRSRNLIYEILQLIGDDPWLKPDALSGLCLDLLAHGGWNVPCVSCLVWEKILGSCLQAPQITQLVAALLSSFQDCGPSTHSWLRVLSNVLKRGQFSDVLRKQLHQWKTCTVPLKDLIPYRCASPYELDWIGNIILREWIPPADIAPGGSTAEASFLSWLGDNIEIRDNEYLDQRFKFGSGFVHPLIDGELETIDWVEQWSTLSSTHWPSMQKLCRVFVLDAERPLPRVVHFFTSLYDALEAGRLPVSAYVELNAESTQISRTIVENIQAARDYAGIGASCPKAVLESCLLKANECLATLRTQVQLFEWLVQTWHMQEVEHPLETLRRGLAESGSTPLRVLEVTIDSASEIFRKLGTFESGVEMHEFVRHFLCRGSVLFHPLLDHFAKAFTEGRSRLGSRFAMHVKLDFTTLSEVLKLCHHDLSILSLGPDAPARGKNKINVTVNAQVWSIVIQEFVKSNAVMQRELDSIFDYFAPSDGSSSRISSFASLFGAKGQPNTRDERRRVLEDACRLHTNVRLLPNMERALQQMNLQWALDSEAYKETQEIADRAAQSEVDIDQACRDMKALRSALGLQDSLDLNLFEVLLQRVAVFDFFVERKYRTKADLTRFHETLNSVRGSLQENVHARQALLENLRHCADVLAPLLTAQPEEEPARSECLRNMLRGLAESNANSASFVAVAENLALMKALFDSVGGASSQLLIFSVREILKGAVVIEPSLGTCSCIYKDSSGEKVTISYAVLTDYIARSTMSLEEKDRTDDESNNLRRFLEQMQGLTAQDDGLLTTVQQLCEVGHPNFRNQVTLNLEESFAELVDTHLQLLEDWRLVFTEALGEAPLLGLVPRTQVFSWMQVAVSSGFSNILVDEIVDAINVWSAVTSEELWHILDSYNVAMGHYLAARQTLQVIRQCFTGRDLQIEKPVQRQGRFIIPAEGASPEEVLLLVAQVFLMGGGPARLPQLSEVLFCEESLSVAEIEAFQWRCERFPELFFLIVEPNRLPLEGKKHVANWLVASSHEGSVGALLTAPWHIPTSMKLQQLPMRRDPRIAEQLRQHCRTKVFLYSGAPAPSGTGPTSGKSTTIQEACQATGKPLKPCILHEGFHLEDLLQDLRGEDDLRADSASLHVDVSAYSDPDLGNKFLRNLLICQTLHDPVSGMVLPLPPSGLDLHVEIGPVAGERDVHAQRAYATREMLQTQFPRLAREELHVGLLYPVLGILGQSRSLHVKDAKFLANEDRFPTSHGQPLLAGQTLRPEIHCQHCESLREDADGTWYRCEQCADFYLCELCFQGLPDDGSLHEPHHVFRPCSTSTNRGLAPALRMMNAYLEDHPLHPGSRLLDVRPHDLETTHLAIQFDQLDGGHLKLLKMANNKDQGVDVRLFEDPSDPEVTLHEFASLCSIGDITSKVKQHIAVCTLSILSMWMTSSSLFRFSDQLCLASLGSTLVDCFASTLRQAFLGNEACLYFVPCLSGDDQGDFCILVPMRPESPLIPGETTCCQGPDCSCNKVLTRLQAAATDQVLVVDLSLGPEDLVRDDAEKCARAVACALGMKAQHVSELLEQESYILTRDFACKFLELHNRRLARVPVIIEGESGTGKSRLLQTYSRLLLESDEVRPPLLRALFDHMRAKLVKWKIAVHQALAGVFEEEERPPFAPPSRLNTQAPEGPPLEKLAEADLTGCVEVLDNIEATMNTLNVLGFSVVGLKAILHDPAIFADLPMPLLEGQPLFTKDELLQFLVFAVQSSPRFDIGRLNFMVDLHGKSVDHVIGETESDGMRRLQQQWHAATSPTQDGYRDRDTTALVHTKVEGALLEGALGEGSGEDDIELQYLLEAIDMVSRLPPEPIYFPIQMHSMITPSELMKLLEPALQACDREPGTTIVVFLDEVNTSSCLGLVKAIMCDGILSEHKNLFIVAAGNPYREESADKLAFTPTSGSSVMRNFFQVHPFPPSFSPYIWRWRTSYEDGERFYIIRRLQLSRDMPDVDSICFTNAIISAQGFMREIFESDSAVSQRDIIRLFQLFRFFWAHQIESGRGDNERHCRARALLLSFGVCYYLGLNTLQRDAFVEKVTRRHFAELVADGGIQGSLDLPDVLSEEMDLYLNNINLPAGIAKTRALKENVFACIVCIQCNIPVMIVGMPGTGKTLAVNIAASNLRGRNGAVPFFRDFVDVANSIFRYQCSKESTSTQIREIFENALESQRNHDKERHGARRSFVFIDEAGLPDERVESLKAIHYFIDRGEVPCCLLANKPLDAAKRNRAVQVFRDSSDCEDLKLLASECLGVQLNDPVAKGLVEGFCQAFEKISSINQHHGMYHALQQDLPASFGIFHLRDFYHCLQYLRKHRLVQKGLAEGKDILRALERNFNGIPEEDFCRILEIFFDALQESTQGRICKPSPGQQRLTLDTFKESLEDVPSDEGIAAGQFDPCRYKMIIDETDDGSAIRVLQEVGLLEQQVQVIEVSDLPGDQSALHHNQVVSNIRRAAEHPGVCIITDFENALDGFYDLLNLRFTRVVLNDQTSFLATVAAGSYSILTPVHPRFQLVVRVRARDLQQIPLPFLNRFEKFRIGPSDCAIAKAIKLAEQGLSNEFIQKFILQPVFLRLEALAQLLGPPSLIGFAGATTLHSVIFRALHVSKVQDALQVLPSAIQEARRAITSVKGGNGEWPADIQQEKGMLQKLCAERQAWFANLKLYGHHNIGATCYLQAVLSLMAMHEEFMPGSAAPSESAVTAVRSALHQSRDAAVPKHQMENLENVLVKEGLIEKGLQQDAVEVCEQLLAYCKVQPLELRTVKRVDALVFATLGLEDSHVYTEFKDPEDLILRAQPPSVTDLHGSLSDLVRSAVLVDVQNCSLEVGEIVVSARKAMRLKQRLLGKLPPRILPICVERWTHDEITGQRKNNVAIDVPMKGLRVPILSPSHALVQIGPVEIWCYNLRSFIVHQGSLECGHYRVFWYSGEAWYCINDDDVRRVSDKAASDAASVSYMLNYELASFGGEEEVTLNAENNKDANDIMCALISEMALSGASQLLQLAPSETVLLQDTALPGSLKDDYAAGPHFGLGALLSHMKAGGVRKCVAFTRDVLRTSGLSLADEMQREDSSIESLPRTRQDAEKMLGRQKNGKPLVVLCRVEDDMILAPSGEKSGRDEAACSQRAVHQLRRMVDQFGSGLPNLSIVVVLLLPPRRLHVSPCYGATFLGDWDFVHLDTLHDLPSANVMKYILSGHGTVERPQSSSQLVREEDLRQDLCVAVAHVHISEIWRSFAKQWCDPAAAFYSPDAGLQQRVDSLWSCLRQPMFKELRQVFLDLRVRAFDNTNIQEEARQAAKSIVGAGQVRSLQCLQVTLRSQISGNVASVLKFALFAVADRGGLKSLMDMGEDAILANVAYLNAITAHADNFKLQRLLSPPSSDHGELSFFTAVFDALQTCLLHTKGNRHSNELLPSFCRSWSNEHLAPVASAIGNGHKLLHAYCSHMVQRLGLPEILVPVLVTGVQACPVSDRLPGFHMVCSQHRSDLAALGLLFQDEVPQAILEHVNLFEEGGLFCERFLGTIVRHFRHRLQELLNSNGGDLSVWHRDFETVRAVLKGGLSVPGSALNDIFLLSFLSDLIPALMGHPECNQILKDQMRHAESSDYPQLLLQCFRGLATCLRTKPEDIKYSQGVLERLLDNQMLYATCDNTDFLTVADVVLDAIDDKGIFQETPGVISLALGSSAMQALLEAVSKLSQECLPKVYDLFNKRLGSPPGEYWPLRADAEWPLNEAACSITGEPVWRRSLPHFLFFALKGCPGFAGVLADTDPVEGLHQLSRLRNPSTPVGAFQSVRCAARLHLFIERAATLVTAKAPTCAVATRLVASLQLETDGTESKLFLDALIVSAGSGVRAGRTLQSFAKALPKAPANLLECANMLSQPERAVGGPGESPWEDLPTADLPGFESEQQQRRRQDAEQLRLDQRCAAQDSRHCPNCRRVITKNQGCDTMVCGAHSHGALQHQEGCGHTFQWSQAQPYQASVDEQRRPPGFTAIRDWLFQHEQDILSDESLAQARAALAGLDAADSRYAIANACACALFKAGRTIPPLAAALASNGDREDQLREIFCLNERAARAVAFFCDSTSLPPSRSLVAAAVMGREGWGEAAATGEASDQTARQLRNALVNLLVTIISGPDNTHLATLFFSPGDMVRSFPVGFVYGQMPGPEGYHFDCGCVLDEQGKAPYNRMPLENRHLHFVNFCSWASLALGLFIFPEHEAHIQNVLSSNYVREVNPRENNLLENARSYAMNFARHALHCISSKQGIPIDDRALCLSDLCAKMRRRALADDDGVFQATFSTPDARQAYEEVWREVIDGVVSNLPVLRRHAMEGSAVQGQFLLVHDFRSSIHYMHRFFHRFEVCSMALPARPELEFIASLLNSREELTHLGLLTDFVRIQKWIMDRLSGTEPESSLERPLQDLVDRRQKDDDRHSRRTDSKRCKDVSATLKRFCKRWRAFYSDHNGMIPVECQAAQAEAGLADVVETRLEDIEGHGATLPLKFFLDDDNKCQPRLVAEYLHGRCNRLVSAAVRALRESTTTTTWAEQMDQAVPVWLSDFLLHDSIEEALEAKTLERAVLRHLIGADVIAPILDWSRVQEDVLGMYWVHHVQRLSFPEPPKFVPLQTASAGEAGAGACLPKLLQEAVEEKLAMLTPSELQLFRELVGWVVSLAAGVDCELLSIPAMSLPDVRTQIDKCPESLRPLLKDVELRQFSALQKLVDRHNGQFASWPPLLKAPAPPDVNLSVALRQAWPQTAAPLSSDALYDRDRDITAAITDLEGEGFVNYALNKERVSLKAMYCEIFALKDNELVPPLSGLPHTILGCHLMVVIQALELALNDVRTHRLAADSGVAWTPLEGVQPLSNSVIDLETLQDEVVEEQTEVAFPEPDKKPTQSVVSDASILLNLMHAACDLRCDGVPGSLLLQVQSDEPIIHCLTQQWGLLAESGVEKVSMTEIQLEQILNVYAIASRPNETHAWQRALTGVQATPLETLFSCEDTVNISKVSEGLWGHLEEKKNSTSKEIAEGCDVAQDGLEDMNAHHSGSHGYVDVCKFPGVWERFVQLLGVTGCPDIEQALSKVLEDSMPLIVRLPKEIDEAMKQKKSILLHYANQYFRIAALESRDIQEVDAVGDLLAEISAVTKIQRRWRRRARKMGEGTEEQEAVALPNSSSSNAAPILSDSEPVQEDILQSVPRHSCEVASKHEASEPRCDDADMSLAKGKLENAGNTEEGEQRCLVSQAHAEKQIGEPGAAAGTHEEATADIIHECAVVENAPLLKEDGISEFTMLLEEVQNVTYKTLMEFPRPEAKCSESFKAGVSACLPENTKQKAWSIDAECQRIAKSLRRTGRDQGLEPQQLYAVVVYAYDIKSKDPQQSAETNFKHQLDIITRNRDTNALFHMRGYMHFLTEGLRSLKVLKSVVYRGVQKAAMSELEKQYAKDKEVVWRGFSTTTQSCSIAKQAAGSDGVVLRIQVFTARDISDFAAHDGLNKVIMLPNSQFKITKGIGFDADLQCNVLDMEELPESDDDDDLF